MPKFYTAIMSICATLSLANVTLAGVAEAASSGTRISNPPPVVVNPHTINRPPNFRYPYYRPPASYSPGGVTVVRTPKSNRVECKGKC